MTIKQKVKESESVLKEMNTHAELRNWAIQNKMDNRSAFSNFKKALIEIGIDYDLIKSGISNVQRKELLSKITHEVTLYSDAKASFGNFAITDKNGSVLWYGSFFANDNASEQSSAELEAAKKAVWLCSKIKEANGLEAIRLNLFVDAQWLTYQDHSGQKGYALTQLSKKYNIDLKVKWIKGTENPADEYTTEKGFKKWSDNNLLELADVIENNEIEIIENTEDNTNDRERKLKLAKAKAKAIKLKLKLKTAA